MRTGARVLGLGFVLVSSVSIAASLGVIGDSLSVGTLTHPDIYWDAAKLEQYLKKSPQLDVGVYSTDIGKTITAGGQIPPPIRLFSRKDEFPGADILKQAQIDAFNFMMGRYLDMEEYAWPFLVGRMQGIPADEIYIAAQAGHRSSDSHRQAKRLLERTKGKLQSQIYILLGDNDLCSSGLNDEITAFKSGWSDRVYVGIEELIANGEPAEHGTTIYVLPPLNPSFLINSDAVLDRKTYGFGAERTCRDLREIDPNNMQISPPSVSLLMKEVVKALSNGGNNLPSLKNSCKTVFSVKKGDAGFDAHLENLAKYVTALNEASQDVVDRSNAFAVKREKQDKIQIKLLNASARFAPETGEEIANDCFHLSVRGQERLTREILKDL